MGNKYIIIGIFFVFQSLEITILSAKPVVYGSLSPKTVDSFKVVELRCNHKVTVAQSRSLVYRENIMRILIFCGGAICY